MQPEQWREAMAAAKLAVRAYARDPSPGNAVEVEVAWQRVRRLQSVADWRRPSIGQTPSPSHVAPGRQEALTGPQ